MCVCVCEREREREREREKGGGGGVEFVDLVIYYYAVPIANCRRRWLCRVFEPGIKVGFKEKQKEVQY